MIEDVPSPIDLRLMRDAREWEQTVMSKRPWRVDFFARIRDEIGAAAPPVERVLELGSGPGFLAQHLLQTLGGISYGMLDFSAAMHQLARARLGDLARHVEFIERDFKQPDWHAKLGEFGCVVTLQAVHELRHKRHAPALHAQVRELLAPEGFYLVCDHYCGPGGMQNDRLYMSVDEQRQALSTAGFTRIVELLRKGGMVLHCASLD
ncbi:MAG TPA: class I SAM-dependent methyltransferase [Gammaproteobacteria bacterium]|nr:class I SAM-dependent methyltransferase [Gammaproteobacteria bacterium]